MNDRFVLISLVQHVNEAAIESHQIKPFKLVVELEYGKANDTLTASISEKGAGDIVDNGLIMTVVLLIDEVIDVGARMGIEYL